MSLLVLIAEDHPDNREILKRRLERQGCAVVEAADGVQAVAAFAAHRPDVTLMDLAMPNLSGLDAMTAIRATPAGAGALIVALTANAMEDARASCLAAGFDAFATKPVDFPALVALMCSLTGRAALKA